jgi:hypothetical protein
MPRLRCDGRPSHLTHLLKLTDHLQARDGPNHPGSSPRESLTACLNLCLHPIYRSVVETETCPSKNWICSNSSPALWQSLQLRGVRQLPQEGRLSLGKPVAESGSKLPNAFDLPDTRREFRA